MSDPAGVSVRCDGVVHIYPGSGEGLDDVVALRGIDLDVDPGEFVSLLGPSGSGKSTVLGLLAGVLRPSAGRVLIGPHDIGRMAPRSLARLRGSVVALVLQNPSRNLLPYATVRQNVAFAAGRSGHGADELLDTLGLASLAERVTGRLSGGEQQCVAIAAALSSGAQLVLADEPTSQLDADSRERVMELLAQVHTEFGCMLENVSLLALIRITAIRRQNENLVIATPRTGRVTKSSPRTRSALVASRRIGAFAVTRTPSGHQTDPDFRRTLQACSSMVASGDKEERTVGERECRGGKKAGSWQLLVYPLLRSLDIFAIKR